MDNTGALPKAVIFDYDGTLADVRHLLEHLDHGDPHLTEFHTRTHLAKANEHVFALLRQVQAAGLTPILISARGERWRSVTVEWLELRSYSPEYFYMRADDDRRTGAEYKRELLHALRREWDIVAAIDDDPKVVAMWQSEGIPVLHVPGYDGASDPRTMVLHPWWDEMIAAHGATAAIARRAS